MSRDQSRARLIRLTLAAVFTAIAASLVAGWLVVVLSSPNPVETAYRDWVQFPRTGERILDQRADQVYALDFTDDGRPEFDDGFFFLYPPSAALFTVPLAFLPPLGAYLACVLVVVLVTLVSARLLTGATRNGPAANWTGVLGTMASAPWGAAVILGHLSATLVIGPALAVRAWAGNRPFWAGASLGLLLLKPNWGLPVAVLLLAGTRWRMLMGFACAGVALFLISLPLGPELWSDWLRTMVGYRAMVTDGSPPWRQVTLFSSIQSILGKPGSHPGVLGTWLPLAAILYGATTLAWRPRQEGHPRHGPRLMGVGLLAILTTNPYAYFYDALLLIPASITLWFDPSPWRDPRLRSAARAAFALTWIWMHVQFFILMGSGPSLAGIGLMAWLILELADLLAVPPSRARSDLADDRRSRG